MVNSDSKAAAAAARAAAAAAGHAIGWNSSPGYADRLLASTHLKLEIRKMLLL